MEVQNIAADQILSSGIKIHSYSVLRGCNVYYKDTVIRLLLSLHKNNQEINPQYGEKFTNEYVDRFLKFSTLVPDFGRSDEFFERLMSQQGVPLIELFFEAILSIEHAMASVMKRLDIIEYAEIIENSAENNFELVWTTRSPKFSRSVAEVALFGLLELLETEQHLQNLEGFQNFKESYLELQHQAEKRRLPSSTSVIIESAKRRNIPYVYTSNSSLWLGQGMHQNQFRGSMTGNTSFSGATLSANKRLTNQRLSKLRLPVPNQIRVDSSDEAVAGAKLLGFPVVVKPTNGNRGRGISSGLKTFEEVRSAYEYARKYSEDIIVEDYVAGEDYRLLVIDGKFVACLHRVRPKVTGNGTKTIRELIEEENKDPHRDGLRMLKIELDEELSSHLKSLGLSLESVIEDQVTVTLRSVANISKGGIPIDVTDEVHPDFCIAAERAARGVGLDVAGIDFITNDIRHSYKDFGGSIIEVNARPGLCIHSWPRHGQPRDVGGAILNMVYPKANSGRVHSAIILGDARTAVVARDVEEFLRNSGSVCGLVIKRNVFLDGERIQFDENHNQTDERLLLRDPALDSLVCTISPKKCLNSGLQLDKTDIVAIMPPVDVTDVGDYNKSIGVLLKSDPQKIVIDADNEIAWDALKNVPQSLIVLVSTRGVTPTVSDHLKRGGSAITIDWENGKRHFLIHKSSKKHIAIPNISAIKNPKLGVDHLNDGNGSTGHRSRQIKIRMFAIVMALNMGMSPDQITTATSSTAQILV